MLNISFSGKVTDEITGNPIASVTVTVYQQGYLDSTTTDVLGNYNIAVEANLGDVSIEFLGANYYVSYANRTVTETGTNNFGRSPKLTPMA